MAAAMVGGGTYKGLAPHLKPMVVGFGTELVDTVSVARLRQTNCPHIVSVCTCTQFVTKFDPAALIDVAKVRAEIDSLMTEKLKLLTAGAVKKVSTKLLCAVLIH